VQKDYSRLNRRDVERVLKNAAGQAGGEMPTVAQVQKFVDEELGVDRAAQAKETKRQREEAATPELDKYLMDLTGIVEADTKKLRTVPEDGWNLLARDKPWTINRLLAACEGLADFLRNKKK
jgi:hypothetical protein